MPLPSGLYVNTPGDLDPPKRKGNRSYFTFFVNTNDILFELKKFNDALGRDLKKHVAGEDPGRKIVKNREALLSQFAPRGSRRIAAIVEAMHKRKRYRTFNGRATKFSGNAKGLRMNLIDVNTMDRETNLGLLDKKFPQKHKAEFDGNPLKKMSAAAKAYRAQKRFALWRMYEYPTKIFYDLPVRAKGPMKFTVESDGHSSWRLTRRVRWSPSGTSGLATTAYIILDSARKAYKQDQRLFSDSVARGIQKIILTKTRFK